MGADQDFFKPRIVIFGVKRNGAGSIQGSLMFNILSNHGGRNIALNPNREKMLA